MQKQNLLNPNDFYVTDTPLRFSIPPKLSEIEEDEKSRQWLKTEKKHHIRVCCKHTADLLNAALQKGITQNDFTNLLNFFNGHSYTDLGWSNTYRDKNKDLDFEKLVSKIFDFAALFDRELRDFFFENLIEDGKRKNKKAFEVTDFQILEKKIKALRNVQPAQEMDLRPLVPYFEGVEKLDLALKAAYETGLINDAGKWVHSGYKTNAISVFWKAAVTAGLAKSDAPIYKVIGAIKEQFSLHFGPNAINKKREIAEFGEAYKELYKRLLAIMRP